MITERLYPIGIQNVKAVFFMWTKRNLSIILSEPVVISKADSSFEIRKCVREIEHGEPDAFLHRLQSFFADTPYELIRNQELHYQNVLFIVFKLVGFYVEAAYHTSQGRIDLELTTDRFIYVMEFKLEGTAEEPLQQIEKKQYAQPFAADKRHLFKIGINNHPAIATLNAG